MGLSFEFRVRSISPIPLEGFSFDFGHMFASMRRCAELITQPCRHTFKVTSLSLEFRVRAVSPIPVEGFSVKFGQIFTSGKMCRTHNLGMGTQGQGHRSRSRV